MLYEANVARGAALLDERQPGWHVFIDRDTLSLKNYCSCVIGQLIVHPQLIDASNPEDTTRFRYNAVALHLGLFSGSYSPEENELGFSMEPPEEWQFVPYYVELEKQIGNGELFERAFLKRVDDESEAHWDELTRCWQAEIQARLAADENWLASQADAIEAASVGRGTRETV
jgi:hypothetical protein